MSQARGRRTEADVQACITDALAMLGYVVLVTSRRRKRVYCPQCGASGYQAGGDGCTPGLPDLLVWVPAWRAWLGLEVKGPTTRVSPEQHKLQRAGMIHIVRSVDDALRVIGAA